MTNYIANVLAQVQTPFIDKHLSKLGKDFRPQLYKNSANPTFTFGMKSKDVEFYGKTWQRNVDE